MTTPTTSWIDQLRWDKHALLPAVVQDAASGQVLMLGYVDRDALERTLETGRVHFWSRRRRRLWLKGETSGHFLHLQEIWVDCDADALLLKVHPEGPTCHTGEVSCFYRRAYGPGE
ncbi:MAG: phosphoribosyl-AMP cyclohydrolase [Chloroflexi bacterium]|nr:phosphoribosyl-AMP cyclohydrolase [Chloroflexota bacterium]